MGPFSFCRSIDPRAIGLTALPSFSNIATMMARIQSVGKKLWPHRVALAFGLIIALQVVTLLSAWSASQRAESAMWAAYDAHRAASDASDAASSARWSCDDTLSAAQSIESRSCTP